MLRLWGEDLDNSRNDIVNLWEFDVLIKIFNASPIMIPHHETIFHREAAFHSLIGRRSYVALYLQILQKYVLDLTKWLPKTVCIWKLSNCDWTLHYNVLLLVFQILSTSQYPQSQVSGTSQEFIRDVFPACLLIKNVVYLFQWSKLEGYGQQYKNEVSHKFRCTVTTKSITDRKCNSVIS